MSWRRKGPYAAHRADPHDSVSKDRPQFSDEEVNQILSIRPDQWSRRYCIIGHPTHSPSPSTAVELAGSGERDNDEQTLASPMVETHKKRSADPLGRA